MSDRHDELLTETIARHFPSARVDKNEIDLGFGGLSIGCRVGSFAEAGGFKAASLFFQLQGGRLGDAPIFASISGYADSDEGAIVAGGCNWACSFGPVLRAALAAETDGRVDRFDVTLDGQGYRLFVDRIDRTFSSSDGDPTAEHARVVRARLGGWPWLSRLIVDSGRLPLLPVKRSTIMSVFVGSVSGGLTVEVKINGVDWPGMAAALAGASNEPAEVVTLLRELAVLVPVGPPAPLEREAVVRTWLACNARSGARAEWGRYGGDGVGTTERWQLRCPPASWPSSNRTWAHSRPTIGSFWWTSRPRAPARAMACWRSPARRSDGLRRESSHSSTALRRSVAPRACSRSLTQAAGSCGMWCSAVLTLAKSGATLGAPTARFVAWPARSQIGTGNGSMLPSRIGSRGRRGTGSPVRRLPLSRSSWKSSGKNRRRNLSLEVDSPAWWVREN